MSVQQIQYTVRGVSARVDQALRRLAREQRKSLHQVILEALEREAGLASGPGAVHVDLDELAGTWVEDPGFDAAIAEQDHVDERGWRSPS